MYKKFNVYLITFSNILRTIYIIALIRLTNKKIFFGPYHGEFGYEVVLHAPLFNSLKKKWPNRLRLITNLGMKAIYNVDHKDFFDFKVDLASSGYGFGNPDNAYYYKRDFLEKYSKYNKEIFVDLSTLNITIITKIFGLNYQENKIKKNDKEYIAFHFRSINKVGIDKRNNYDFNKAKELVSEINKMGYRTICIGHEDYSWAPENISFDARSKDISTSIEALNRSFLCIGQLSGPIHLANCMKVDVITWAEGKWRFKIFPKWNPFNKKVYVVSQNTFNPGNSDIIENLFEYLNSNKISEH